jgi:hypothetical protein
MNFTQSITVVDRLLLEQRGKKLDSLERQILAITWEGGKYAEIPEYQEQTVKNRALQLWKALSLVLGTKVNKNNFRPVIEGLEVSEINSAKPRASRFYGRAGELWQLERCIQSGQSKLIFIDGPRGIGKTALVRKLAENLAFRFDRVIWISLADSPPIGETLLTILKELGLGSRAKLPHDLSGAIEKTIDYLRGSKCLLVFDPADGVNRDENLSADYRQFLDYFDSQEHDSYYVVISSNRYLDLDPRHLQLHLSGLDYQSCQKLVESSELIGTPEEWHILVDRYQGNPRYLQSIAMTIRDMFQGYIRAFLAENLLVYENIKEILSAQLDRLSPMETAILLWLSIEREPVTLDRLKYLLVGRMTAPETTKTLERLVKKYFVEVSGDRFGLSTLVMEYMTERYQDLVAEGIYQKKLEILKNYPLVEPDANHHLRQQQEEHILLPIISKIFFWQVSTPPHKEILRSCLLPIPKQDNQSKQQLIHRLEELLSDLISLKNSSTYKCYGLENIKILLTQVCQLLEGV